MTSDAEREGFAAFLLRARGLGITGRELIAAIEATPRSSFVSAQMQAASWSRRTIPIECGEAIEGIDLQAQCLAALQLQQGHRVCEIGTGSGFTSAVMARLTARVVTIERYKRLAELAGERHSALGLTNVVVKHADGAGSGISDGPFDRIISWCAFESMPRNYVDQLASGGIMITAIGSGEDEQPLAKLTKVGSRFEREDIGSVRFQPIIRGLAQVL